MSGERFKGRVIRLFSGGFGFIAPEVAGLDPGGRGIYFHALCLRLDEAAQFDTLRIGAEVEFAVQPDGRGQRAVDVSVVREGEGAQPQVKGERQELRGDGTQVAARRTGEPRRRARGGNR